MILCRSPRLLSILSLTALLALSGCSEDGSGSSSGGSRRPRNPIEDTPIGGAPETTGFWINMKSNFYTSFVSSSAGFGEPCFINKDDPETDLTCFIDVTEGDLYMYDMEIQYNVPPQLCAHVETSIPWYWNFSSGIGPAAVDVRYLENGSLQACTAYSDTTNSMVACGSHPEIQIVDNQPKCIYDLTAGDGEGPNCCFGEYTLTTRRENTTSGTDDIAVDNLIWGSNSGIRDCLGGPIQGPGNWEKFSKQGYPLRLIQPIGKISPDNKGLNDSISLTSNGESLAIGVSYTSNFFTTTGNPHSHTGYGMIGTSNRPYALDPINDLDRSPFQSIVRGTQLRHGEEAYQFTCLDEGFEVKHRIRVYIREWNTFASFLAFEESEGSLYDPDVDGTEGVDCEFTGIGSKACNDSLDLDDIIYLNGGPYDTSVPDAAARARYFPQAVPAN